MCDTIVVVRPEGVLFAKNSDRDANEAQLLEWHPRRRHAPGEEVQCTYVRIPQVRETNAILISRPFWMWGAEMGANEHGVAIGNEAVFTRQPYARSGLTGMDLLRLALERADDALEACNVITQLLTLHGQGGGCGHENRDFTYHNSFLVADPRSAYVLETAGRLWAIEAVTGARSISNGLTIPGFREAQARRLHGVVAACDIRQQRTMQLAARATTPRDMMAILRDYGEGRSRPQYRWLNGGMGAPCMHAGGLAVSSQTTASWVSELREDGARHWATATSVPSLSLFKPVSVGHPLDLSPAPTDKADHASLWWKHERLCRRILRDPDGHMDRIREECGKVESEWGDKPPSPADAFATHHALLDQWLREVPAAEHDLRPWYTRRYWRTRDRLAGLAPGAEQ
ncbi:MAG: hypothetical protein RLZZ303_714 [Candidatus Hydrogenedentota bacterium]